jgi:PhnB protein
MSTAVSPVPPGYHTLTPHLIVSDAKKAAEFYQRAFGAEVRGIAHAPDGKVIHAEVKIGDSILMFNDEIPAYGVLSPTTTKANTCVTTHMYVPDADKVFASAIAAGAKVIMPLQDQFWGDRYGTVEDPFGHRWSIATHIKDQSPEEMKAAMDEAMAKMASHS